MEFLRRVIRFRVGHLMVLTAYCAVLAWMAGGVLTLTDAPMLRLWLLGCLAALQPSVLGFLVLWQLDRGPVREWVVAVLRAMNRLLGAGLFAGMALIVYQFSGRTFTIFAGIASFMVYGWLRQMLALRPGRCGSCGHRTVIATLPGFAQSWRSARHQPGTCLACAAPHERSEGRRWVICAPSPEGTTNPEDAFVSGRPGPESAQHRPGRLPL